MLFYNEIELLAGKSGITKTEMPPFAIVIFEIFLFHGRYKQCSICLRRGINSLAIGMTYRIKQIKYATHIEQFVLPIEFPTG